MIFAAAKLRGVTLEEMESMTLGQLIDFVVMYNNLTIPDDGPKVQKATQAHWDSF